MIRQCLICDSQAKLTLEAAKGIALLIGLADGALRESQNTHENAQGRPGYNSLVSGLAAIAPAYPSALRVADDVGKYQFSGVRLLMLVLRRAIRRRDSGASASAAVKQLLSHDRDAQQALPPYP